MPMPKPKPQDKPPDALVSVRCLICGRAFAVLELIKGRARPAEVRYCPSCGTYLGEGPPPDAE